MTQAQRLFSAAAGPLAPDRVDLFDGLAEIYDAYRPEIAPERIAPLIPAASLPEGAILDVGAGTGKSTQALRKVFGQGRLTVAIEPSRDMRRVLRRRFASDPAVQIIEARAEQMAMPTRSAALVAVSDVYHWLHGPQFWAECAQVLRPGGMVLFLCHMHETTDLMADFNRYFAQSGTTPSTSPTEPTMRFLTAQKAFMAPRSYREHWQARYDRRGLIDLCLADARHWDVVRKIGLRRVTNALSEIYDRHHSGAVTLTWTCSVKTVKRRA